MLFNAIKTVILLALLSGLFMFMGNLIGGSSGLHIAFIMALVLNGVMYFFSDRIVLSLYKAIPLDKNKYASVYNEVSHLAEEMKIPMPRLWLINTPMANAFATGRSPKHASIAVTTGILSLLNQDELRGVLSHELAHVKNRDILISTIAATLATAIGYLANMLQYAAFWGSLSNNRDGKKGNPLFMLLVAILMPIAAALLQFALSRSREYEADDTGARNCKDPLALASALKKLEQNVASEHFNKDDVEKASTASLFIVNPFTTTSLVNLFSTHPPMNLRIERLQALYKKMFSR